MNDDLPEIKRYRATEDGPHFLVLGQVHGSEPCGRRAIKAVMADLDNDKKKLLKGQLTFVPCANPRAAAQNLRYVEENLNRVFEPHDKPESYEQHIANHLVPLFHEADYILDMHSTMAPTLPYIFSETIDEHRMAWIAAMNVPHIIKGWEALYPIDGDEMSTESYASRIGKHCFTIECGQNNSKEADKMALRYLRRSLRYFDMINYPKGRYHDTPKVFRLKTMYRKEREGHHTRAWKNFSGVKKGMRLFEYENGHVEMAPYDATIFLPKGDAQIGWDWLYLAQQEK